MVIKGKPRDDKKEGSDESSAGGDNTPKFNTASAGNS